MARMVPAVIDPQAPASERRVFSLLQQAPGTHQWTVLHSLGLSNAYSGEYGEIDFVVLVPDLGVVCVEVKGGGIAHQGGQWSTTNSKGETFALKRSPFRQAKDAMWKLREALDARFGKGAPETKCPLGWIVVFPDALCPPVSTEFVRGEVIDRADMERDIAACVRDAPSIANLSSRQDLVPPSRALCERLLSFLRPNFERIACVSSNTWDIEQRIRSLTEEQYGVLDAIADNPTCVVYGPAGTGKTLLAVEFARRLASSGMDAVLTCFNWQLGSWLVSVVRDLGPGRVVAGHLHGLLRDRINRSSFASDLTASEKREDGDLYTRTYFELGALAVEEQRERFGAVIVDEVQDIPPMALAALVQCWTAEQDKPRVLLLGDFTRQALYGNGTSSADEVRGAFGQAPVFGLGINCRNTRRIAIQTDFMSGFAGTRVSPKQPEGDPVEVLFYKGADAGVRALEKIIVGLRRTGFRPCDAVVLGPRRIEASLLSMSKSFGGWQLSEIARARETELAYSTIHSFKGLERPVVIVVDATTAGTDETDALLYVAMSRARLRLFVLCPEESRVIVEERLARGAAAVVAGAA